MEQMANQVLFNALLASFVQIQVAEQHKEVWLLPSKLKSWFKLVIHLVVGKCENLDTEKVKIYLQLSITYMYI